MRSESYKQYAIVAADSAQILTEELNAKLKELKYKHPEVTFEGLIARISYTENFDIPETLGDEYELQGAKFCCEMCPYYEPILKADGTRDERVKYGDCQYSEYGRTFRDSRPCEMLWQSIKSGEVKLCLAK